MSDLIHQLRQGSINNDDYRWRAADEITALAETISQQDQHIENLTNINDRLRTENEKLREALRQIAGIDVWDNSEQGYVDKARAALEAKQ